jgi:succinate dehydrogenase / fumarate reductase cytochrome b subunit
MRSVFSLYRSSVGKKIVMAVSGIILFLWVVAHMLGNLKVFFGQEAFDHYAHGLKTFGEPFLLEGQFLLISRFVMGGIILLHMVSAMMVWLQSRAARKQGYKVQDDLTFTYDSRTMRWGGVIVLFYILYHLGHFTVGCVHPDFVEGAAYRNLVIGFQVWWVSIFYLVSMMAFGLHLYHGLWSACQTLNFNNPMIRDLRRPAAMIVTLIIVLGFVSVPISVLAGIVTLP